jgi:hypothetical protein
MMNAAAASAVRPCASSSRRGSVSARATAASKSSAVVLGGVTLPAASTARAARVHRRRGAVVTRAEGEGIQRDDPTLEEKFATVGCVRACACVYPIHHNTHLSTTRYPKNSSFVVKLLAIFSQNQCAVGADAARGATSLMRLETQMRLSISSEGSRFDTCIASHPGVAGSGIFFWFFGAILWQTFCKTFLANTHKHHLPTQHKLIHLSTAPHNKRNETTQVRRARVPELHVHVRAEQGGRLLPRVPGHHLQEPARGLAVSHVRWGLYKLVRG